MRRAANIFSLGMFLLAFSGGVAWGQEREQVSSPQERVASACRNAEDAFAAGDVNGGCRTLLDMLRSLDLENAELVDLTTAPMHLLVFGMCSLMLDESLADFLEHSIDSEVHPIDDAVLLFFYLQYKSVAEGRTVPVAPKAELVQRAQRMEQGPYALTRALGLIALSWYAPGGIVGTSTRSSFNRLAELCPESRSTREVLHRLLLVTAGPDPVQSQGLRSFLSRTDWNSSAQARMADDPVVALAREISATPSRAITSDIASINIAENSTESTAPSAEGVAGAALAETDSRLAPVLAAAQSYSEREVKDWCLRLVHQNSGTGANVSEAYPKSVRAQVEAVAKSATASQKSTGSPVVTVQPLEVLRAKHLLFSQALETRDFALAEQELEGLLGARSAEEPLDSNTRENTLLDSVEFGIRLVLAGEYEKALVVYERIARTYPNSDVGKRVTYTVGGSAQGAGKDHRLYAGQVQIPPGESGSISIPVVDEDLHELPETVVVSLVSATNAVIEGVAVHTLTIDDNDPPPTVQFWQVAPEPFLAVDENDGAALLFVTLSGDTGTPVTVAYSIYTSYGTGEWSSIVPSPTTGTITIETDPDDLFRNIAPLSVGLIDDDVFEDFESINVKLSDPQEATLGSPDERFFIVRDDEEMPYIKVAPHASGVDEDSGAQNGLSITLSRLSALDTCVSYFVGGSAEGAGVDYSLDGSVACISPGESGVQLPLSIVPDILDEDDETIEVTLSAPENAQLSPDSNGILTIVDDDPEPGIHWLNDQMEVDELDGTVQIPFELTCPSGRDVQVYYTHTAVGGQNPEYSFSACPVGIPAGSRAGQVTLTIGQDEELEATEQLLLSLPSHSLMKAPPVAPATCQVSVLDALRLTVQQPSTGGSIRPYPPGPLYKRGAAITLYANKLPGWRFDRWTGDFSSVNTPLDLVLLENKTVGAQFIRQFELNHSVSPSNAGTTTSNPSWNPYDIGSSVTLTAEAAPHYRFVHWKEVNEDWTNTIIATTPTTTVVMDKNRRMYAVFQHQFTLTTVAVGGGTVTPQNGDFDEGAEVTLSAVANPGFEFSHWIGPVYDIGVSQDPATGGMQSSQAKVLMDADKTVEALFAELGYSLEVTCDGLGMVLPSDGWFAPGAEVTLYASAFTGWYFDHWTGDLSGSDNPAAVTMNGPKHITAVFLFDSPYDDDVVVNTEVIGRGKILPSEIMVPAYWFPGNPSDPPPQVFRLFTAQAEEGARFDHWSGGIEGNENPGKFMPYHYPHVVATFVDICDVEVAIKGEGAVMPGTGEFGIGVPSTFTGTPAAGFRFHHWVVDGQVAGTEPTLTITPDGDTSVQGVFTRVAALTVLSMPSAAGGAVNVDPLKGAYDPGDHVSLLAAPAEAWRFYRWEKNGAYAGDVNPLPVTVQDDTIVAAWFVQTFEYTATATAGGSVYPTHKTCDIGTTVAATATPEAGRVFVRWDGDVPENFRYQRHIVLTMDQSRAIQPVFGHALTVGVLGGGTIRIGDASSPLWTDSQTLRNIPLGQEVTLTAVDTENARFLHWLMPGGAQNTSATIQMALSESSTFSAVFEPAETSPAGNFSLAVAVNGQGKVTVDAQDDKAVRNYGVFSYAPNSNASLTASPAEGYVFSRWSGDATGSGVPLSVTMDGPKAITAHFHAVGQTTSPEGNDLSVRVIGGGTVVSNGWWFPIPGEDEEVPLAIVIAKPNFGWRFDHWEGDSTDTLNITGVIMDADRFLTAVFVPGLTLDVSAIVAGGNVYVGAEEDWIPEMPDALNAGFAPGQEAQFTAVPQDGWEFDHWTGLPAGSGNTVSLTMNSHLFAQPVFVPLYPVSVVNTPGGTVTVTENGTANGAVSNPALFSRRPGTTFTLTATPNPGWHLDGWDGPVVPQDNPVGPPPASVAGTPPAAPPPSSAGPATANITVTDPAVVSPRFLPEQYDVTATATIPEGAEMVITPLKQHYHYGDRIEISAIPKPGYRFAGWQESLQGASTTLNPWRGIVAASLTAIAKIEGNYVINCTSVGSGSVKRTKERDCYCPGEEETITAEPSQGWGFDHWEGDVRGTATSQSIEMNSSKMARAVFLESPLDEECVEVIKGVQVWRPEGGEFSFSPPPKSIETIVQRYDDVEESYAVIVYKFTYEIPRKLLALDSLPTIRVQFSGKPTTRPFDGWSCSTGYENPYTSSSWAACAGSFEQDCTLGMVGSNVIRLGTRDNANERLWKPTGTLTITTQGNGHVIYTFSNPVYMVYGFHYQRAFHAREGVPMQRGGFSYASLEAVPKEGWRFIRWEGSDCGQSLEQTTIPILSVGHGKNGNIDARAVFEPLPDRRWTLSLNTIGSGSVAATSDSTSFGWNEEVTVTATPDSGWTFSHWRSASTSPVVAFGPSYTFNINKNTTLEGVFVPKQEVLRVELQGQGHVQRTPNAVTYTHGSTVTLTPQPAPGWEFHGWKGDAPDDSNHLVMDGAKSVTAVFVPVFNVQTDVNDDGHSDAEDDNLEPFVEPGDSNLCSPVGELIRVPDLMDNGIGYGQGMNLSATTYKPLVMPTPPLVYTVHSDDLQLIDINVGDGNVTTGTIDLECPYKSLFRFFKGTDLLEHSAGEISCVDPKGEITFPYDLSKEGPLPDPIFVMANMDASAPELTTDLRFKYSDVEAVIPDMLDIVRFTIVPGPGAPSYFAAAQDYMVETGSKLLVDRKTYSPEMVNEPGQRKLATHEMTMRFVIMNESRTRLTVLDAFEGPELLKGIENVANAHSDQTVITSGNFAWDVRAIPGAFPQAGLTMWGPCYARRCRGLVVSNNRVLAPSTYESDFAALAQFPPWVMDEAGKPVKETHKYVAQASAGSGLGSFIFGSGKLENVEGHNRYDATFPNGRSPYRDAMGGLYGPDAQEAGTYGDAWMNYSGGPCMFVGETGDLLDAEPGSGTRLLFIAASEFQYYSRGYRGQIYAGRKGAGRDMMNSGAGQILFLDADSSVALAYRSGSGSLLARIVGLRHRTALPPFGLSVTWPNAERKENGRVGFYHIPTYLMFKVN